MLARKHPDRIQIAFDDTRLVANAGLLPSGDPRPSIWVCVNSPTATLTWETRRGGRTRETRC